MLENSATVKFTPALAIHIANVVYYRNRQDEVLGRALDFNMAVLEKLHLEDEAADWEQYCARIMEGEF